jgi:hypothetical protein
MPSPTKMSFRDPSTNVLKAWGYVDSNQPGDIAQDEDDDFVLAVGEWQYVGGAWVAYTPPS